MRRAIGTAAVLTAGFWMAATEPSFAQRVWGQEGETIRVIPEQPGDPYGNFLDDSEPPPAPEILEEPAPAARSRAGEEAHLRFLDRRTSTRGALVSPVGSTARYGQLIIEVAACHIQVGGGEDSAAFLKIREEEGGAQVFSGWIFASSPSLSALDHPRYDVWVAACKTAEGSQSAENRPNSP